MISYDLLNDKLFKYLEGAQIEDLYFLKSLNEILFHLGEKTSLKIEIFLTCAKIIEC